MYLFHAMILKITHLSRTHNPLTCFNNYANYAPPENIEPIFPNNNSRKCHNFDCVMHKNLKKILHGTLYYRIFDMVDIFFLIYMVTISNSITQIILD